MSLADPIADMLTQIRNALMVRKSIVEMPYSKIKVAVAEVLRQEGYIFSIDKKNDVDKPILCLVLKYYASKAAIDGLKRISKPSRRIYVGYNKIPKVMSGLGINILSTSRGIMSERKARKEKVGGEILCAIW